MVGGTVEEVGREERFQWKWSMFQIHANGDDKEISDRTKWTNENAKCSSVSKNIKMLTPLVMH
jgi:hypothetical protein